MTDEYDAGYENYIDGLHREIIDYQIEVEQVKGENAKLRELVRTIYMCSDIRCNECEYGQGNTCTFDAEAELHKLGVEP